MPRHTRYQGLIIKDQRILLIQHTRLADGVSYWVIPGGGKDPGETDEQCVIREIKEETNLDVRVEKLLITHKNIPDDLYAENKSFLCRIVSGDPAPGYEPELEASAHSTITDVGWFDLSDVESWEENLVNDPFTYPQLMKVKKLLGF